MLRTLAKRLRRFAQDTTGSYSVELVLVFPTLIWGSLAVLTYVDGYRAQTMNLRTTYAISDLLSRQGNPVGPDFIDGLARVHQFMTGDDLDTHLRVSVVYCNENDDDGCNLLEDDRVLVWSDVSDGGAAPVTASTLSTIEPFIPALAHADTAIVVETWLDYVPPFNIGLPPTRFYNYIVTSPRFIPQLKYDDAL